MSGSLFFWHIGSSGSFSDCAVFQGGAEFGRTTRSLLCGLRTGSASLRASDDADAPYAGSREREAGVYGRGLSGMDGRRSWTVRGCRQASADETNGYKYVEYGSVPGNLLDVTESFFIFAPKIS